MVTFSTSGRIAPSPAPAPAHRPTLQTQPSAKTQRDLIDPEHKLDHINPHKIHSSPCWVIDPREVGMIAYWDLTATAALIFVSLVTPIEVGFLVPPPASERWSNGLFLANRMVDLVFICDMFLQFCVAYKNEDVHGSHWVTSPKEIVVHYVTSTWFALDLFSILTSVFDLIDNEDTKDLTVLRVLRTLRLVKLVKLARGSRIFKRWEMRLSINYDMLTLLSVTTGICLACHWLACLWGLQASFEPLSAWPGAKGYCEAWEPSPTELLTMGSPPRLVPSMCPNAGACDLGSCEEVVLSSAMSAVAASSGSSASSSASSTYVCTGGYSCVDAFQMYSYALYFSIMTVTSVGYGDVSASAFNPVEQLICGFIMLFSGMLWGYLVGVFCTIAASAPSVQAFRDELSQLNSFMKAYNLNADLRFRLREFIHETVHLRNAEARSQLLSKLSPAMQGEVSLIINQRWVKQVWYLHEGLQLELLIEIASRLRAQVYAPWEFCPCGLMYIVNRGTALYSGRPRHAGAVWGDDVLLDNDGLQLDFTALAATYLWVFTIDGGRLLAAVRKFPESAAKLHAVARRWLIRRALVRHAERESHKQGLRFRGRIYPIYAKELALLIANRRYSTEPSPTVRMSRLNRLSRLSRLSHGLSRKSTDADGGSTSTESSLKSPFRRRGGDSASKNRRSGVGGTAMKAAANFGLQLRKEQMRASLNDEIESERKIGKLQTEVAELRADMKEVETPEP